MGNKGLKELVCEHFGRAPTYTIVDTETNDVRIVKNVSEHMGGTGTPPEHLSKEGIEVMLASGLGPKAVMMFEGYGIKVYVGASGTVEETIKLWKDKKLEVATDENACRDHRH
jgi:predicted Fe-Mo cluster-binding NifX family protein